MRVLGRAEGDGPIGHLGSYRARDGSAGARVGVDPGSPAGSLVWRAAADRDSLAAMIESVTGADADRSARCAARNHLRLADAWDVFGRDGPSLFDSAGCARLDLAGLDRAPMNAVVAGVAGRAYSRCIERSDVDLPWLCLDEAHVFFEGVAAPVLRRLLTRGRGPGVSLVDATQRPSALPPVAISQADPIVVHRLTGEADREALASARPAYMSGSLDDRMPAAVGEALVIDDATETVHTITVRERDTPHDGENPRAVEPGAAPGGVLAER